MTFSSTSQKFRDGDRDLPHPTGNMDGAAFLAPVVSARLSRARGALSARRVRGPRAQHAHHVAAATAAAGPAGAAGVRLGALADAGSGEDASLQHRLSPGERARTVVHVCKSGTLCTSSLLHDGVPFGSHADYILCEDGRPAFLLANEANHTRNLAEKSNCSLYTQPPSSAGQDGCRATLVGRVVRMEQSEADEIRERYIDTHAHAEFALTFPDMFAFYKMEVDDVFYVGGFGVVAQWVSAEAFLGADPDPLCFDAPGIVKGLNEKKEDDMMRLCKIFLGVEGVTSCTLTGLDRLGFDLRVRDSAGAFQEYRVAFREKVENRFDVQSALVKTFQEAWEREMGYADNWADDDERPAIMYYSTPAASQPILPNQPEEPTQP